MAFAEVGSGSQRATNSSGSGDSSTLAFPGNVTAGNLLIVGGAAWAATAPTGIVVTDSRSTSYTVLSVQDVGNVRYWIAYGVAASSGACTVTVNPQGASADHTYSINEFSGQHATPLDVDDGASSGQNDNPSSSITTVAADALIIGVMTHDDDAASSPAITPGASYTQIGESENNSTNQCHSLVFRIVTTAQAYTVNWTLNIAVGKESGIYTASFKPAVAATSILRQMMAHHGG